MASLRAQGARLYTHTHTQERSLGRLRGGRRHRAAQPACEHPHEASRRSTKRRHDVNIEVNGYEGPHKGKTRPLSIGFGVGKPHGEAHADTILFGPELQFGNVVGNHIKKQVLLLKYAVGGSSLYKDWRPPSATASGRDEGPQVCGTNCGGKKCLPDAAEGFTSENKADSCCDFCCVRCEDAKCKIANGGTGENCQCGRRGTAAYLSDSCGYTDRVGTT